MPTATATELAFKARSIGPAVPPGDHIIIVESVFSAALNLRLEGFDLLATLTGPEGAALPHAVSLGSAVDFRGLSLLPGDRGVWRAGFILIEGREGRVLVDCGRAARGTVGRLPAIERLGGAFEACVAELARRQAREDMDLRIDALLKGGATTTPIALALVRGAESLASWARAAFGRPDGAKASGGEGPRGPVERLVGLGVGLTPSGDDYLAGFTAGLRAAGAGDDDIGAAALSELCDTIESAAAATNEISASLLRGAARGFYHEGLLATATGIASDDRREALAALEGALAMGHSSGADMMTGFFHGLALLLPGGNGSEARYTGKRSLYAT
jgi:hypothetical protein